MRLTPKNRRRFLTRTRTIYRHQRERAKAAGQELDYDLIDLRELVLEASKCPSCLVEIRADNFSLDHLMPTSRGGRHCLSNLRACCLRCNQVKGLLTLGEFAALRHTIARWPPIARKDLFARLRAGGRMCRR